tara:strand:+ start:7190 stop:8239 length:1050 start_codon:yes stop_codon:yes gene_type:complete
MDSDTREFLLHRIFSATTTIDMNGVAYIVKHPTRMDRYKAQRVYNDSFDKNKYNNWYTKETIVHLLEEQGIFSSSDEEKLKKLDKDLEELKLQLFQSVLNIEKSKFIRKSLDRVKTIAAILNSSKYALDYLTLEGYASLEKTQYLIASTLFHEDGSRVFSDNYKEEDTLGLIEQCILEVSRNQITAQQSRELSRTEPWRNYWGANKTDIFGLPSIDLTEEQRSLMLYSKMYDGAYEHPECPEDSVIQDDDMFDGWMIFQRRKREKSKTAKQVDSVIGAKQREAEELFIPSPSQDGAQKIHNMNTFESKIKRQQREKVLNKNKVVKDSQFPDRRQQIITQANREFAEKVR